MQYSPQVAGCASNFKDLRISDLPTEKGDGEKGAVCHTFEYIANSVSTITSHRFSTLLKVRSLNHISKTDEFMEGNSGTRDSLLPSLKTIFPLTREKDEFRTKMCRISQRNPVERFCMTKSSLRLVLTFEVISAPKQHLLLP